MRKRSPYTWAAIAFLALPTLSEGLRLVLNRPWPGFVAWNSHVVSAIIVSTMAGTIFAMVRGPRATIAERVLAMVAPILLACHSLVLITAKNRVAFLYVLVAALFVFVAQRAFRAERRELGRPPTIEVLRGRFA